MGADFVGEVALVHVVLDAKVMAADAEVEVGGHGDGREIGGSVEAGADVVVWLNSLSYISRSIP